MEKRSLGRTLRQGQVGGHAPGFPNALDITPAVHYGRLLVARRPNTLEPMAAGWDNAENRRHAIEWLEAGLLIEMVPRAVFDHLAKASARHVFDTRVAVGELLTRKAAIRALAGY